MASINRIMQGHQNRVNSIKNKVDRKREKLDSISALTLLGVDLAGGYLSTVKENNDVIEFGTQNNLTYSKEHNLFYGLTPDNKAFRVPFATIDAIEDSPVLQGAKDNIADFFYTTDTDTDNKVSYNIKKSYTPTQDQYMKEVPNELKEKLIGFDIDQLSNTLLVPPSKNTENQWRDPNVFNPINYTTKGWTKDNIAYYMNLEGVDVGHILNYEYSVDSKNSVNSMPGISITSSKDRVGYYLDGKDYVSSPHPGGRYDDIKRHELFQKDQTIGSIKYDIDYLMTGEQEILVNGKPLYSEHKTEGYYQPEDFYDSSKYSSVDEALDNQDIIFPTYFLDQFPQFSENMFEWSDENTYIVDGKPISEHFTTVQQMYSNADELKGNEGHVRDLQTLLFKMNLLPTEGEIDGIWGDNTQKAYDKAVAIHFSHEEKLLNFPAYYEDLVSSGLMPVNFLDITKSFDWLKASGYSVNMPYQSIMSSDKQSAPLASYTADSLSTIEDVRFENSYIQEHGDGPIHHQISFLGRDHLLTSDDLMNTQKAWETMLNNGSYADAGDFIEIYANIGEQYDEKGFLVKSDQRLRINPWEWHVLKTYGGENTKAKNIAVGNLIQFQKDQFDEYNTSFAKQFKNMLVKLNLMNPEENLDHTGRIALNQTPVTSVLTKASPWVDAGKWMTKYVNPWLAGIGVVAGAVNWISGAVNEAEANQALKKQIRSTQRQLRGKAQEDTQLGLKKLGDIKDTYKHYIGSTKSEFSNQDTALMEGLEKLTKQSKGLKMDWEGTRADALKAITDKYGDKMKEFKFGFQKESDQIRTKLHSDITDISGEMENLRLQYKEAEENDEFLETLF